MSNRDDTEVDRFKAMIQLKDATIKNLEDSVNGLRDANVNLRREKQGLTTQVSKLIEQVKSLENQVQTLSLQRPSLSSENLLTSFKRSLDRMQESLHTGDERIGYTVGKLDISLKTNLAISNEGDIRYQFPLTGEVVPPDGLSTIHFSLLPVPKVVLPPTDTMEVPNLIGVSKEEAEETIRDLGFKLGTVVDQKSMTTPGLVINQSPEAYSRAAKGAAINIVISKVSITKVPNVIGVGLENAIATLSSASLKAGKVIERESPSTPKTVISQSITAGTQVPINTSIDLVVAKPEEIKVPEVKGRTIEEAKALLEKFKLKLGEFSYKESAEKDGIIIHQEPAPGELVSVGSAIVAIISEGVKKVVPDLRGKSLRDATEMLEKLGLKSGKVIEKASTLFEGTIIGQEPGSGTELKVGEVIDIIVASGKLELVEGIGSRLGERLRRIKINTFSELAKAPFNLVSRAIGESNANNLISRAKIVAGKENLLGVVDDDCLEALITATGIFEKKTLTEADPEQIYEKLRKSLENGDIKLPEAYELTLDKIRRWVEAAK